MVAVAIDASIKVYDFRTPREAYNIEKAHAEGNLRIFRFSFIVLSLRIGVRDVDFNPNKSYYFASGGDDTKIKFWDYRNTKVCSFFYIYNISYAQH